MTTPVRDRYRALIDTGQIERDPAQEAAVTHLDSLVARIESKRLARKSSALGWLFGQRQPPEPLRGLYLWGPVGRGKTMLMDMFFEVLTVQRKRRAHFHSFMTDVHGRIHAWRQAAKAGTARGADAIAAVAEESSTEAWVLCFDEFTVNDIADAMILGRLFEALFHHGVVLVATSNVDPRDLYAGGLNRALFEPFIALLLGQVEVRRLEARTDFRLEKLAGAPVYLIPADAAAGRALDAAFTRLSGGATVRSLHLPVQGRYVPVPRAAGGVARFSFAELCEAPLAGADYLVLARAFHTLVLDAIPVMTLARRNEAKRFIILIDVLYETNVKLICSAEAEPIALYHAESGREAFEFERTASRLIEMRSEAYLARPHGRPSSRDAADTAGLVET